MKVKKKQQQRKESGRSSKITPLYKYIVFVDKLKKNALAVYYGFLYRGKWNALVSIEIFRSKWSTSRGGPL